VVTIAEKSISALSLVCCAMLIAPGTVAGEVDSPVGKAHWPRNPAPREGAPNIVLILTDDVGFGSSSGFGGPVPTPSFDAIAARGLKYNTFHTTGMCSPTRASLLTGRNPHNVNMGTLTNRPTGVDGYTSVMPDTARTVAEILKRQGYSTAAFGKWHLTPEWEVSQSGPFNRWPTGMGFEYFFGFLNHGTSHWAPSLVEGTQFRSPPDGDPSYHFERDLADHAINWIEQQQAATPDKPFFVYYSTAAAHAPHHIPQDWLQKFTGKFDQGWDRVREETFARQKALGIVPPSAALTPRPAVLPAWESLSADQKRYYARLMEAYAAALSFSDHQIGRVIEALGRTGKLDNTLIVFIEGDNGSSAEGGLGGFLFEQDYINAQKEDLGLALKHLHDIGGPALYQNYPAGWAWAMDTPFQYYKQVASHLGATRNALAISWPAAIKARGELRTQYHFVADIMPTLLEAAHIAPPKVVDGVQQMRVDGVSMLYSFNDSTAPSKRNTQVYELFENAGIYSRGWTAAVRPLNQPWTPMVSRTATDQKAWVWELYDLRSDFAQAHDLAQAEPKKLEELEALFWAEARRNHILPIHPVTTGSEGRPTLSSARTQFTYGPGIERLPEAAAPPLLNRSFSVDADVVLPDGAAHGVILSQGGRYGGYALYLADGKPVFHYNAIGPNQYEVRSSEALAPGAHKVSLEFRSDGNKKGAGGDATLRIDGRIVGAGRIERTLAIQISGTEGLDIGRDTITPVSEEYTPGSSVFSGTIDKVTVTLQ
jgi:arylsulfatase A-like enzyme